MRLVLLPWTLEADPHATASAYRRLRAGAGRRCGCPSCRNFDAARPLHFCDPFLRLLRTLGVDPKKELSVRLVALLEHGRSLYAGSYAFSGEILAGRPFRGFPWLREEVDVFEKLGPRTEVALRPWTHPPLSWTGGRCVRVEFIAVLPWVLEAPRPAP